MKITVLHNQSLLDLAVMYCGSAVAVFGLALTNGLSVSDDLSAGAQIEIPGVVDQDVADYYKSRGLQPATAITISPDAPEQLEGIGYWILENDFVVQ